ncbi:MAG: YciI family protein [Alphaproteobacteria bacterium]|nr:YciI family protein [Alphaproteobacteria bacterium]
MIGTSDNPGGYRADDPRYGLSGQTLQDYYLSRPPEFYISSLYKPDSLLLRDQAMDPHLAHVRSYAEQISFSGPLLTDDGSKTLGTMAVVNVADRSAAEAYVAGDGFAQAGLLLPPQIIRFISSKRLTQTDREPDPSLQMFACECLDGPNAATLRKQSAAAHHVYQGSIIDKYLAHGPLCTDDGATLLGSLFIIEVAGRAAAEGLVGNEPMAAAGVFDKINIYRWRYGKPLA